MSPEVAQRATLIALLAQHSGDFPAAYNELQQQYGKDTVPETKAANWAAQLPPSEIGAEAHHQLQHFIRTGEPPSARAILPTAPADLAQRKQLGEELETGALRVLKDVLNDTNNERFPAKVRAGTAMKIVEVFAVPDKLRVGSSAGRSAHMNAPQVSTTFGTISDRAVFTQYVREGLHAGRLAEWLRAADPQLGGLDEKLVVRYLTDWQRVGVVMGPNGEIVPWEEAVADVRERLRIAPPGATE